MLDIHLLRRAYSQILRRSGQLLTCLHQDCDKEGVQRLLGTVNYLDKFIENKAAIQGPISQLLQKDAAFVWDTQQRLAFDKLKQVISKSPVLAYFDNNKQTVLNADASSTGLGAVVMQDGKPIAYATKTQ